MEMAHHMVSRMESVYAVSSRYGKKRAGSKIQFKAKVEGGTLDSIMKLSMILTILPSTRWRGLWNMLQPAAAMDVMILEG